MHMHTHMHTQKHIQFVCNCVYVCVRAQKQDSLVILGITQVHQLMKPELMTDLESIS